VTITTATQPAALSGAGLRRVVVVLSITVTASYGVVYYALPVLLGSIVSDTGWSATQVTAAFSVGQIVAALVGVGVGHWIDRHGPRGIMTGGSALGVLAVVLVAGAGNYTMFFAAWIVAGIAMSAIFYPPAFAALTHWGGERRVPALTTLTLVAGLASTIFAPLTASLNGSLSWRETYLVLAAVLALVTLPMHWIGLRQPWAPGATDRHESNREAPSPAASTSLSRPFIMLAVAFSLASFTVYAALVNLVPLLEERGLTAGEAAIALGLGGLGQVCGRFGYAKLAAATRTVPRTVMVIGGVALTTAALAVLPGPMWALILVSTLVGMLRGLLTLVEATAVSDRWGVAGFGRLNGILTAPTLVVAAIGPFAGAAIAEGTGSQGTSFLILAAVAALAAALALGTAPRASRTSRPPAQPAVR
jgi:MFS family permease